MASTLTQKLRIKDGFQISVLNAPSGMREKLDLPASVSVNERLDGQFDLIWYFATQLADLPRDIQALAAAMKPGALLWLTYPKGGSGVSSDLKRDVLWEVAGPAGLEPVAQIAVDDVWTALRFKGV